MNNFTDQTISLDVIREKYAKGAEKNLNTVAETKEMIFGRVADALSKPEASDKQAEVREAFFHAYSSGLIPAGRVASAAGTDIKATLINCFVQPVGDAIQGIANGKPGIYDALRQAAETMRRGGGVGYAFGDIRPRGAYVKGTASNASGPVSYMHVFDKSCQTVESAGARRGAQMGVCRIDHPDIEEFVNAKQTQGALTNFNISVGVTEEFMQALVEQKPFELYHEAEPSEEFKEANAGVYQREDGMWIYRTIDSQTLWDKIMQNTYDAAEPGILFLTNMNRENNLWYCEVIEASNPCAEQPLPSYGCCCLSSVNLAAFVRAPFQKNAEFDFEEFSKVVRTGVRTLDNVLELTYWPLEEQRQEAMNKRRVGLGYTALGDALIMLGLRYDCKAGRDMAEKISRVMRDEAYRASVELAKEKGAFPLFDAEKYLASGFAKRLPKDLRAAIKKHGIRNSHLLSIAPTGTISLAFADNASNGLEPAFSWFYERKKRLAEGGHQMYRVEDHAFRVFRESMGVAEDDDEGVKRLAGNLPESFVSALEIEAIDHMRMMAVIQPYVDSSLSKTVNVPADYPFESFKNLYLDAWKSGLKGLATFRPNFVTGSVLSTSEEKQDLDQDDPDRRIHLDKTPEPVLASLRWPSRPETPAGNPSMTYTVNAPNNPFAVFIGHLENGEKKPFEVWVNGAEQPRGIGALAKTLSTDMRSFDRKWLQMKLDALSRTSGEAFDMAFPPKGEATLVPSATAALARLIEYRCNELGTFDDLEGADSPMVDALFSKKEPKSGTDGTLSWTVDVKNPATGDDFVLFMKELVMPDGSHRPYSVWMAGKYPDSFDGLCKSLSIDMRIIDAAWIAKKLRSLTKFKGTQEDFLAREPGSEKQQNQPSTVAYVAKLILHRYKLLGILNKEGYPNEEMGVMDTANPESSLQAKRSLVSTTPGKECPDCGNHAMIKKDGCDFCTSCGHIGSCG